MCVLCVFYFSIACRQCFCNCFLSIEFQISRTATTYNALLSLLLLLLLLRLKLKALIKKCQMFSKILRCRAEYPLLCCCLPWLPACLHSANVTSHCNSLSHINGMFDTHTHTYSGTQCVGECQAEAGGGVGGLGMVLLLRFKQNNMQNVKKLNERSEERRLLSLPAREWSCCPAAARLKIREFLVAKKVGKGCTC